MGRKRWQITGEFLTIIFGPGAHAWLVTAGGLPPDSAVVDLHYDREVDRITLLIESRDFPAATSGEEPVEMAATTLRDPDAVGAWCPVCRRGLAPGTPERKPS